MKNKIKTITVEGFRYEIEIGGTYFYHGDDIEVLAADEGLVVFNYLTGEYTGEEDCCSADEFVTQNPEIVIGS